MLAKVKSTSAFIIGSVRRGVHFVTLADTQRRERDRQRVGSRRHADRLFDADVGRDFALKGGHLFSQDHLLQTDHALHRRPKLAHQFRALDARVEDGDIDEAGRGNGACARRGAGHGLQIFRFLRSKASVPLVL